MMHSYSIKIKGGELISSVLILVLMDDALVLRNLFWGLQSRLQAVLILVLMDDALVLVKSFIPLALLSS